MKYTFKSYGENKFLIIKDPYTGTNLEAIDVGFTDDPEILGYNILSFYDYYDFNKSISYNIYVTEFKGKNKVSKEDTEYCTETLVSVLNIPKTQALQLIYMSTYLDEVKVKTTKCHKEAYSIYHNLYVSAIESKLIID